MKHIQKIFIGVLLGGAISVSASAQTIKTGEDAVQTKEGLYLVEGAKVDVAYVSPNFNLANYDRIMVGRLAFSLEESNKAAEKKRRRSCSKSMDKLACTRANSFAIDEDDQNKMADLFADIMAQRMEKGPPIEIVNEPSAGVLVFQPTIMEITLTAPKDSSSFSSSARGGVYTQSSGSITLVGQFFDGETGELIALIVDQQIGTDIWHRNTQVSNWADIRMAFHTWIKLFRTRLDQDFTIEVVE
ncbi:MAG: DUF3313 family protein [Alphaproteobacteria bacterium]|nr:MAG: DUF3313 family protein [Alphaproteobacteria bacterium]